MLSQSFLKLIREQQGNIFRHLLRNDKFVKLIVKGKIEAKNEEGKTKNGS